MFGMGDEMRSIRIRKADHELLLGEGAGVTVDETMRR